MENLLKCDGGCGMMQVATVYTLPADGSAPSSLSGGREVKMDQAAYELEPGAQVRIHPLLLFS